MTMKTTLRSLSFVLAASVSSFALAQGLGVGVGAGARIGTGGVQAGAGAQSSGAVRTGSQHAAPEAGIGTEGDASIDGSADRAGGQAPGSVIDSVKGAGRAATNTTADTAKAATRTMGTAGESVAGIGASAAANANVKAKNNPIEKKAKKPKQIESPVSGNADAEINASSHANTKTRD